MDGYAAWNYTKVVENTGSKAHKKHKTQVDSSYDLRPFTIQEFQ